MNYSIPNFVESPLEAQVTIWSSSRERGTPWDPAPHLWDLMPPAAGQVKTESHCRTPAGVGMSLGCEGTASPHTGIWDPIL